VAHFTMFTKPSYVDFAALMSFAGAIFFPKNHAPLGRDLHALAMAAPTLKCGAVPSRLIGSLPYRPRAMLLTYLRGSQKTRSCRSPNSAFSCSSTMNPPSAA
jgi:hypothetical protein